MAVPCQQTLQTYPKKRIGAGFLFNLVTTHYMFWLPALTDEKLLEEKNGVSHFFFSNHIICFLYRHRWLLGEARGPKQIKCRAFLILSADIALSACVHV